MTVQIPDLLLAYLARIGQYKLLTHEEEVKLLRAARAGDRKARARVVEKNLRFVVGIAKRYRGQGLPFEDLIQEGNIGRLKAVQEFDPGRGWKFSTYTTWWIRQAVGRAITDKGHTIRVPAYMAEKMSKVGKAYEELSVELKRKRTEKEVAERLGWNVEKFIA